MDNHQLFRYRRSLARHHPSAFLPAAQLVSLGLYPALDQSHRGRALLGLSFTNLTATGSGDIMALSAPGRVLLMLEQFIGAAYVAMVVSRLVGMTLARRKNHRTPGS